MFYLTFGFKKQNSLNIHLRLILIFNEKYKKSLLIFMPFIGGGGVENLFIISNFLSKNTIM